MKLIIAEKPSVAQNIASALGASKTKGHWENANYLVTSCVGHLCELAEPERYDPTLKNWTLDTLPILPTEYQYEVKPESQRQFDLIQTLMQDSRVTSLINACDGDREGELIFRLVYALTECTKPVERLWVSSMKVGAILDGMNRLRPMQDYDPLAQAAYCRETADWLIGINLSRLYSLSYSLPLAIGRVQTPVLALIVQREQEIASFTPQKSFVVTLDLGGFVASCSCESIEQAEQVKTLCKGKNAVVTRVLTADHKENPPVLYNLTALQEDCSDFFGATSMQTAQALQNLYESSLATYPRTTSRFITEKDRKTAIDSLEAILSTIALPMLKILSEPDVDAIVKDSAVKGHPALLPIAEAVFHLHEQNTLEQQILLLLMLNLLEATAPKCRYDTVEVELSVEGQPFTASGMTERFAGWRDVERSKRSMLNLPESRCRLAPLPPLKQQDSLVILSTESKESKTKPPQRYTEATLLQAMEEKGLGTPATRAQIIENLVWNPETGRGFVTRGKQDGGKTSDTKHFYPTKNGMTLISLLPDALKSPSMTADWEKQLTDIAQGTASAEPFDASIRAFVRELVEEEQQKPTGNHADLFEAPPKVQRTICSCPICKTGNIVVSRHRGRGKSNVVYHCTDLSCPFRLGSPLSERVISEDEVKQLCQDGVSDWLDDFRNREGKPYSARLKIMDEKGKHCIRFARIDEMAIASCPVCGNGKIVPFRWKKDETTLYRGWQCSHKECKLKRLFLPKCQREFDIPELQKLFTTGELFVPSGLKQQDGTEFIGTVALERDKQGSFTGKIITFS